jgi:gliding motility-associated-like protein
LYYRSNINVACGTVNPPFTSSNRPNIKFYNCNTVNPSNYTYTWTPATGNIANATQQTTTGQPTANTTYTVTVTDIMNGCTDTDSVNVTLSAVSVNSTTICNGQTASLIANPSIAGGTYLWAPSGGTGATENVSPTTTTTYTVSYTVPGCTITATATVAVDSVFNKNQNFHLCMGQSVTVGSNTYSTTGIYTDSLATYKGCDSILITTLTIDSIISTTINSSICIGNSYMLPDSTFTSLAGLYTDTISSQLGCDSIIITNLTVSSPAIVISPDATIQLGDSIALNASGATSYVWFPGLNLNCINCSGPIASPIATTIYCVAATDSSGCSDTACVTITVESRCDDFTNVGFPNIFTPNNDGNNDVMYFLKGWDVCVESFHVAVYDRWGIIVFESTFPNREWDGRISNGMEAADGVYYYVLKIKNKKGEEEQTKGFINLIR